jgi:hypothetical protein
LSTRTDGDTSRIFALSIRTDDDTFGTNGDTSRTGVA